MVEMVVDEQCVFSFGFILFRLGSSRFQWLSGMALLTALSNTRTVILSQNSRLKETRESMLEKLCLSNGNITQGDKTASAPRRPMPRYTNL